jgi:hypothetical protein
MITSKNTRQMLIDAHEKLISGVFDHKEAQAVANIAGKLTGSAIAQLKLAELRNEKPRIEYLIEDERDWDSYTKKIYGPRTKANIGK